jgi:conjugative transfer signal peptidase TraF
MTRLGYARLTWFATLAVAATALFTVPVKLVWNASASVPVGFYSISKADAPKIGDLVLIRPSQPIARFMAERQYVGPRTPLLKHVVAVPGQQVCRFGVRIIIDGNYRGSALSHDRSGRPLPIWQGCHTLQSGQLFLMNHAIPNSLDGRYFGPTDATAVIGRAIPLFERSRPVAFGQQQNRPLSAQTPQQKET